MDPKTDLNLMESPRCAITIADVFVEVGLAGTTNDVRLCCALGSAQIDGKRITDWQEIVRPESLIGRTLRFINREWVCGFEMNLLGFVLRDVSNQVTQAPSRPREP